ncbi:hypothetical protein ANTRET_LOCUS6933 [Anthophora retusa]
MNRTIIPMIAKLADERNAHWYDVLEDVEFACNNTVNRSTGEAPSVLLYGVYQRGKVVDCIRDMLNPSGLAANARSLETVRDKAAKQIKKSFDQNKQNYDKKRKVAGKYKVGDRVMLRNFVNLSDSAKLVPQFKGPYEVAKVLRNDRYVIKDIDGFQVTQMPFKGTWAVWNMRPWLPHETDSELWTDDEVQIRDNESDSGSDIIIPKKRLRAIGESSDDELNGDCTEHASIDEFLDLNSRYSNEKDYFTEVPGSQHLPDPDAKPIEYFSIFFSISLLSTMVTETNRNAKYLVLKSYLDEICGGAWNAAVNMVEELNVQT